jgi:predicted flap endonuclease-1-like 5' DNA nuclease/predicted  nucleic acid-binding Zn-ribbon protein
MLTGLTTDTLFILLGTGAVAALLAWLVRGLIAKRAAAELADEWESRVDHLARKRNGLLVEADKYRLTIEAQQVEIHKHMQAAQHSNTSLNSAVEKINSLSKDLFTLRAEREDSKEKLARFQSALNSVQHQSQELQREFIKSREFYKAELRKAFEKRKALEVSIDNAKAEQDSLRNLLTGSRSEQESVSRMLESAKNRLAEIDKLERDVVRLEADNAQLNHDAALARQEIEVLKRDVIELDELRVHNTEMSEVIKSMEASRRQYEEDARRYQGVASESEKQSETLRIRLDEVEQNFQELEKQQQLAIKQAREEAVTANDPNVFDDGSAPEVDDLKEIVGIGKVFEGALNELGVYSFRQLANFGITDIARVNAKLKEFKGRMEQDDWIGQAKELLFKKYGNEDSGENTKRVGQS